MKMADAERRVIFVAMDVLVAGSAYDLFEFNVQAGGTVASTPPSPVARAQVNESYGEYLSLLNTSNIELLPNEYTSNATITWRGIIPGLAGNYTGTLNIQELFGVFLTRDAPNFRVLNETHTIEPRAGVGSSTRLSTSAAMALGSVKSRVGSKRPTHTYKWVAHGRSLGRYGGRYGTFTAYSEQYPVG